MVAPSGGAVATTGPAAQASSLSFDGLTRRNAATVQQSLTIAAVPSNLKPSLADAHADLPTIYSDGCLLGPGTTTAGSCLYGDPNAPVRIALFGDSHAAQWFPALEEAARKQGWQLLVLAKKGCSPADFKTYDESGRVRSDCAPWKAAVAKRLTEYKPDIVFVSSYRYRLSQKPLTSGSEAMWRTAVETGLRAIRPLAHHVLWVGDTPDPANVPISCLSAHVSSADKCVLARATADKEALARAEKAAAAATDSTYVHTPDWFCSTGPCVVMLGNIMVYRDDNHITATMSRYFAPFMVALGRRLLGG